MFPPLGYLYTVFSPKLILYARHVNTELYRIDELETFKYTASLVEYIRKV